MPGRAVEIAIVDDDASVISTLQRFIHNAANELGAAVRLTSYPSALDLVDDDGLYDIIFLDVEMPFMDGMEAARQIRGYDERARIVFVTSFAQYAVEGYEVNAFDFILKPVTYGTFAVKFKRVLGSLDAGGDRGIVVHERQRSTWVSFRELRYCEKRKNDIVFRLKDGEARQRGSLSSLSERLEGLPFAQINSGCIVNLRFVSAYDHDTVTVDGDVLPLSRRRRTQFVDRLLDYLGG